MFIGKMRICSIFLMTFNWCCRGPMEFNAIVITAFKCSVTEELREFNLKISIPFAVYCGMKCITYSAFYMPYFKKTLFLDRC